MEKIIIVGGGLAGCALGLFLAKKGYQIDIFEMRPDIRDSLLDHGRSINLALSRRGMTCLEELGLLKDVMKQAVAMRARAIYDIDGSIRFQSFGRQADETLYSVKRSELNCTLISALAHYPNVQLHFNHTLVSMRLASNQVDFVNDKGELEQHHFDRLFAADGASSKVRQLLSESRSITQSRVFLPHIYKELSLATSYTDGLVKEHLHLWPRNTFLLLGNPNYDGSVTGTLFLPKDGYPSMSGLQTEDQLRRFMGDNFPNVYPHMPNLCDEFFDHPKGNLSTVKTAPWYVDDKCLLLGDAAHAIVPFFGQGMNCAFEDCRILNSCIEDSSGNWAEIFKTFYHCRKANSDAIAQMSMDNYMEIEDKINDPSFNLKKALDGELMQRFPKSYVSKHVMVMFTNLPYAMARDCGVLQKQLLNEIGGSVEHLDQIDWHLAKEKIATYTEAYSRLSQQYHSL